MNRDDKFGRHLNTVDKPSGPCPACRRREPMEVYELAVRWACGQTRPLPPLGSTTPLSSRGRAVTR